MAALGWLINLDFAGGAAFQPRSRITLTAEGAPRNTTVADTNRTCVIGAGNRIRDTEDN